MTDFAHRHIVTATEGSHDYHMHATERQRGTVQFHHDSKVYVYRASKKEAVQIKRWFASTFNGDAKARGKWPTYYVEVTY
jgi:hypothetical protein